MDLLVAECHPQGTYDDSREVRRSDKRQFPFVFFTRYAPLFDNRVRARIKHPLIASDDFARKHLHRTDLAEATRGVNDRLETLTMVHSIASIELNFAGQSVLQPICVIAGALWRFTLGDQAAAGKFRIYCYDATVIKCEALPIMLMSRGENVRKADDGQSYKLIGFYLSLMWEPFTELSSFEFP